MSAKGNKMTDKPLTVKGLTELDYNSWKHHPVTKIVNQFIADKKNFIERTALEQWINGGRDPDTDLKTLRGQIIELTELHEMPFMALEVFYGPDSEKEIGTEDHQNES